MIIQIYQGYYTQQGGEFDTEHTGDLVRRQGNAEDVVHEKNPPSDQLD